MWAHQVLKIRKPMLVPLSHGILSNWRALTTPPLAALNLPGSSTSPALSLRPLRSEKTPTVPSSMPAATTPPHPRPPTPPTSTTSTTASSPAVRAVVARRGRDPVDVDRAAGPLEVDEAVARGEDGVELAGGRGGARAGGVDGQAPDGRGEAEVVVAAADEPGRLPAAVLLAVVPPRRVVVVDEVLGEARLEDGDLALGAAVGAGGVDGRDHDAVGWLVVGHGCDLVQVDGLCPEVRQA
ncbi:hypothetical protein VMCG_04314 [Cytospora schulzeri]|uniref:Uncharacterized protein n=1 Tax=Cytospora schulzeri TaxID=448051 RepID=A0A423WSR6_9PEZI|nr:hypothetical protein VMCG_04314 [Valsa malicola]